MFRSSFFSELASCFSGNNGGDGGNFLVSESESIERNKFNALNLLVGNKTVKLLKQYSVKIL